MLKIIFLFPILFVKPIFAQKDSITIAKTPIKLEVMPLFSPKHFGTQLGLSKLLKIKEVHKVSQKIIFNERFLSFDLGFYTQPELHNSLFLTGGYSFRRVKKSGLYSQFRSFLGLAKTFLNEESYLIDANNKVVLNGIKGNTYLTGGFGLSIGKEFAQQKSHFIRDFHMGVLLQTYYPNFRFISLKPAFQIGLSADVERFKRNYKKIVIQRK